MNHFFNLFSIQTLISALDFTRKLYISNKQRNQQRIKKKPTKLPGRSPIRNNLSIQPLYLVMALCISLRALIFFLPINTAMNTDAISFQLVIAIQVPQIIRALLKENSKAFLRKYRNYKSNLLILKKNPSIHNKTFPLQVSRNVASLISLPFYLQLQQDL